MNPGIWVVSKRWKRQGNRFSPRSSRCLDFSSLRPVSDFWSITVRQYTCNTKFIMICSSSKHKTNTGDVVWVLSPVWLFWRPMDYTLPTSSVHGISQARMLSGLPFPSPGKSSQSRDQTCVFCIGRRILYHWTTREDQYRS